MSWLRHTFHKLKTLAIFILPALGLAFEIIRWKQQDIQHRAIYCAMLVVVTVLCLIVRSVNQAHPRSHRRRRHRQEDFR